VTGHGLRWNAALGLQQGGGIHAVYMAPAFSRRQTCKSRKCKMAEHLKFKRQIHSKC